MYEGDVTAVHYLDNAVKAKALYLKDREYVVKDGEVVIVDEFTGRLMPGRRWSDGLHQAVEAKERVKIQRETRTYATITIQNYFRMYDKLAGMTGTAATEAEEIYKVYKLEVTVIPTNKPMVRKDDPDLVYKTEQGKWDALVRDVKERNTRGQPVLIGTTSVDKSQRLSDELRRHGLKHEVLNAKNHEREALIIAGAGQQGAITVSTNMAGRGVDILLGEGVKELGGLHVIGTERHEARRIDNQLRGRSGRQGDPGNTRFYNSLEDDLIRIFASDRIAGLMTRLGFDDAAPIESGMVTGGITQAQIKVETRNFDIRKRALEFDDVLNNQRNVIYSERRKILEKGDVHETVLGYLHDEAAGIVDAEATSTDAEDWDVEKIAQLLGALLGRADLTKKDFGEITSQDALGDRVAQLVDETYEKREQELGPEISRAVERWVMLRTIDTHWIEHLTAMEELREGIYLRGYGQQDPLVAYKREAHDFFEQMRARIAGGVAQTIMRVSVRTAEQAEQEEQQKNTTSTSGNGKSATGRTDLRTNRDAPGGNGQTTQTGGPVLHVRSAATGADRAVFTAASDMSGNTFAWSSDGTGLVIAIDNNCQEICAVQGGTPKQELWTVDLPTGATEKIATGRYWLPVAWDRTAKLIAAGLTGPGGYLIGYDIIDTRLKPYVSKVTGYEPALLGQLRASSDARYVLLRAYGATADTLSWWPLAEPQKRQDVPFDGSGAEWRPGTSEIWWLAGLTPAGRRVPPCVGTELVALDGVPGARRSIRGTFGGSLVGFRVDGSAAMTWQRVAPESLIVVDVASTRTATLPVGGWFVRLR